MDTNYGMEQQLATSSSWMILSCRPQCLSKSSVVLYGLPLRIDNRYFLFYKNQLKYLTFCVHAFPLIALLVILLNMFSYLSLHSQITFNFRVKVFETTKQKNCKAKKKNLNCLVSHNSKPNLNGPPVILFFISLPKEKSISLSSLYTLAFCSQTSLS